MLKDRESKFENNPVIPLHVLNYRDSYYKKLITDNLSYIDKRCRTKHQEYNLDKFGIEPVELFNEVIDHLTADNYKALQKFENRNQAKLITYIRIIIDNRVVDIIRKINGRDRSWERAKKIGPIGEKLHELIICRGYQIDEAYQHLVENDEVKESFEEIEAMVEKIRGKASGKRRLHAEEPVYEGISIRTIQDEDTREIITPDPASSPEEMMAEVQGEELAGKVLKDVVDGLNGEELLILRMRFSDNEDEKPKELLEISEMRSVSVKAVDSKIRRILAKCKEMMLERGLTREDLIKV